jgi:hypothetical protein
LFWRGEKSKMEMSEMYVKKRKRKNKGGGSE